MPIEDLWPPVRTVPIFVDEIKKSISMGGLMNPIIVVRPPREDARRHFKEKNMVFDSPPYVGLQEAPVTNTIWGGSNRLEAVKQLGYTHVDCVLIPDFFTAMQLQTKQRVAYKQSVNGEGNGSAGDTIK